MPAELAGAPLPRIASGEVERDVVFGQFQKGAVGAYLAVTRRWKYIYSAPDGREWLFDLAADPEETRNRAENPMYRAQTREMRRLLTGYFQSEGYAEPLDGDDWRRFPKAELPADPDAGLLFQAPPASIAAPAPGYERGTGVAPREAYRLLQTPK